MAGGGGGSGTGGPGGSAGGGPGGSASGGTGGSAGGSASGGSGGSIGGGGGSAGTAGGGGTSGGGGGSGSGGSSTGGSSCAGATGTGPAFTTEDGGYVRVASWQGYAFAATESPWLGTIMVPTSFAALHAGDPIASYGYVKGDPDPALRGVALVGFNLNQAASETPNDGAPWVPTCNGGVTYDLDLTDSWILPRVQLTAASGSPPQTWCAMLTSGRPGSIAWSSFNLSCADDSAVTPYDGVTPLVSLTLRMPGGTVPYQDQSNYFDFVVRNLAPY